MTLLSDLDTILDYVEHRSNTPMYMDPVVKRLREAEKRLRDALASVNGAWDMSDENITRGLLLKRINGEP